MLVEAGAAIPVGHLEIIVMSLMHVEINTTLYVCQTFLFVEITEIIVQMPQSLGM